MRHDSARSVIVRGGEIVTPDTAFVADVLMIDGRIHAIGTDLGNHAEQVIDARGCLVLPGGIDAHTHIDFAPGQFRTSDTFTTGTSAAALGGTTCVLDFALQQPGSPLADAITSRRKDISAHPPVTDVGLHLILRHPLGPSPVDELRSALAKGVCDFKIYLAHRHEVMVDDDLAYRFLRDIAEVGALAMIHAENGYLVDALRELACEAGDTGPAHHASSRPVETEIDAVNRSILLAQLTGASIYIVHLSAAESVAAVARARTDGIDISAETCPQYLLLDEEVLSKGDDSWQYIFAPPPRTARDRRALWHGLASTAVSTVASDHSPYLRRDKQVAGGDHADFRTVPNGIPGVQERLPLLYEHGVRAGRISANRMVDVFATTPARLFGLRSKGSIRVGADADVVVFDPTQPSTIGVATSGSGCDFNAYEGERVSGSVDTVLVRGQVVVHRGERTEAQATGRFVHRSRS